MTRTAVYFLDFRKPGAGVPESLLQVFRHLPDGKLLAVCKRDYLPKGRSWFHFGKVFDGPALDSLYIYEVESGRELGRIEFPKVRDAFTDGLDEIQFSGDGQYLVTSTRHTQVWRITRNAP
jgi:hypothetical protein